MKVLHIQTALNHSGNAAYSLHSTMLQHGIDSKMLMYNSVRTNNYLAKYSGLIKFIKTHINRFINQYYTSKLKEGEYLFTYPNYFGTDISKNPMVKNTDVIYLHWIVGGFLTLGNITKIAKLGKPVIFFMHDMWTITGGCHHSFDCIGYEKGCFKCPKFKSNKKKTLASKEFKRKKELFDKFDNLYFVSPSKWLDTCASKSGIISNHFHCHISNIVDDKVFKPFDKETAKIILNIPIEPIILTFGNVAGTSNRFKGWEYLKKAINKISLDNNILLLIYGSDYDKEIEASLKFPVIFIGKKNDEESMVLVSNATDIYISPSLAESFGLTFLENILCNTPVIGFNVGGIPEIIKHKENGYLAEYKDSEDLTTGIQFLINNKIKFSNEKSYTTKKNIDQHIEFLSYCLKRN